MPAFPEAKFLKSTWETRQFPAGAGREVAFAGRSNAGKSSAINAITGRTKLARTSKTPGQTQLINFFDLSGGGRLVDLPGYGYAKVSIKMREHWKGLLAGYIKRRHELNGIVLLMDVRHPLTEFDWQMLELVHGRGVRAHLLLTKCDKLSRGAGAATLARVRREVQGRLATVQLFSAVEKTGLDAARAAVLEMLAQESETTASMITEDS
jgi:GTP-binding protein